MTSLNIPKLMLKCGCTLLKTYSISTICLIIWFLILNKFIVFSATCPDGVSKSTAIFTELDSFPGFTNIFLFGITIGPQSDSLYLLYSITNGTGTYTAVKKSNDEGGWKVLLYPYCSGKSLAVDKTEFNVLFSSLSDPVDIIRMETENGSIIDSQRL